MAGPPPSATFWPESPVLIAILGLAALGAALLLGVAMAAFVRRRSRPYLLIAAAVAALLARTAVAALTVTGHVPLDLHHVLEHGLDVVMVALVVAAVYAARAPAGEGEPS